MSGLDRESWLLEHVEHPDFNIEPVLRELRSQAAAGRLDTAETWAGLALEALSKQARVEDALAVLELKFGWQVHDPRQAAAQEKDLLAVLGAERRERAIVRQCGLDKPLAWMEVFRRLRFLLTLEPGQVYLEKSWGMGAVRRIDWLAERVEFDFEKKAGHQMSLGYAAEALRCVPPEHLMAWRHAQPEEAKAKVKQEPAFVVRKALESYGAMTSEHLQMLLVPSFVPAEDWKTFWEGARKGLKGDARVRLPKRKSDPIQLLDADFSYDAAWFAALAAERDLERILEHLEEFAGRPKGGPPSEEQLQVLANRLDYVIHGASLRTAALWAHAGMLADRLNLFDSLTRREELSRQLHASENFLKITHSLPARRVREFMTFLYRREPEATRELLLDIIPQANIGVLNEVIELLLKEGQEAPLVGRIKSFTDRRAAPPDLLLWLIRTPQRCEAWGGGSLRELSIAILETVEKTMNGSQLRAQNQIREIFSSDAWLKPLFEPLDPERRADLFLRIRNTPGWPNLDRQSMLGRLIKMYPELQVVLTGQTKEEAPRVVRTTSLRSYGERQEQFRKLIQVEIPRNSRDIAHARSYGDLSENHEFKTAKEMQGILMKRRADLEAMLKEVKPTEFAGVKVDKVAAGACVTFEYADGRRETYTILGVWDRDESLNIISCESALAVALLGHAAGETVEIPGENGPAKVTLVEVKGASQPIREWIRTEVQHA